MTPTEVWKAWCALPKEEQHSNNANKYKKMCGMKSMAEVETAALLDKHKIKYSYEGEAWSYQHDPQDYVPDFPIGKTNLVIEVKGKATRETRLKMKAIKKCNPDKVIVIRFLKGKNKISAGAKSTYLDWFRKQGFICFDWHEEKEFIKFIKEYNNGSKGLRTNLK